MVFFNFSCLCTQVFVVILFSNISQLSLDRVYFSVLSFIAPYISRPPLRHRIFIFFGYFLTHIISVFRRLFLAQIIRVLFYIDLHFCGSITILICTLTFLAKHIQLFFSYWFSAQSFSSFVRCCQLSSRNFYLHAFVYLFSKCNSSATGFLPTLSLPIYFISNSAYVYLTKQLVLRLFTYFFLNIFTAILS